MLFGLSNLNFELFDPNWVIDPVGQPPLIDH